MTFKLPALFLIGLACASPFLAPLAAQEPTRTGTERGVDTDVRRYERLITKLRALDAEYRRAKSEAMDEMRDRNGRISHTTATRIDTLYDELRLTESQLAAVAAVTGRPVPDIETLRNAEVDAQGNVQTEEANARGRPAQPTIVDGALRRAKRTLLTDLQAEAREIVRRVRLPVTTPRIR